MKLNSKNILRGAYLLIVLILFGILIFKSVNFKDKEDKKSSAAATDTTKPTETQPTETKPTETQTTEVATEAVKTETTEGIVYSAEEINNYIRGAVPYTGEKLVFLTFDDGPNNDTTGRILDILKEHGVKGTFFLQGKNVNDSTAEVFKRIHAEGNGIAMHSFSHDYKYMYPNKVGNTAAIIDEAKKSEAVFKKYLGDEFVSKTWRYPGGHMSWKGLEEADKQLKAMGVEWVDWNSMNGDAEPKSRRPTTPEGLVEKVGKSMESSPTKDIAVVLMHDTKTKELTVQTLPQVIQYFKDNGFKFAIFN